MNKKTTDIEIENIKELLQLSPCSFAEIRRHMVGVAESDTRPALHKALLAALVKRGIVRQTKTSEYELVARSRHIRRPATHN